MKKLTIITTLFLLLATVANSQEKTVDNREKFEIGAKVGGSYSNVYNTQGEEFDADGKFGLTGGAFLIIPISKYMGVQPEVLITQKGFKGSGRLLGGEYNFKRTTTFLEIPILFALKPSEFFTLVVGPQFSYLLNQRDVFRNSVISLEQEQEFDQDNIRKNILGVMCGIDINMKHVVLGGRMGWDFLKNKGDGTSSTPKYKNVCSQITVGYKF